MKILIVLCAITAIVFSAENGHTVENTYSPIEAAVDAYDVSYGMDDTCRMMFGECNRSATNIGQRLQCLAQVGMCLGAKVQACSKDCIPPLMKCKMSASGNWPAMFKCSADFLRCAIGGCTRGGGSGAPESLMIKMEDDDYSPYEMAIATAYHTTDIAFKISLQQCKASHDECIVRAGTHLPKKVGCFIRFGTCIGLQAVGCTARCLPGLALCELISVGNWVKTFICATKFVFCAKSHCLSGR